MATEIKITDNFTLKLNLETQISPKGRPFRLSGSRINLDKPEKYIKNKEMFMHHFFYRFRYVDKEDGFFEIECDYEDKYINNSLCKL